MAAASSNYPGNRREPYEREPDTVDGKISHHNKASHLRGTIFLGLQSDTPQNSEAATPSAGNNGRNENSISRQDRLITGFLYSRSRSPLGEFWPLYAGQNIVGNSAECDVALNDESVARLHSIINISDPATRGLTEACISDLGSQSGTLINGRKVEMSGPAPCKNGDIIRIGENFELLLILIDMAKAGKNVASPLEEATATEVTDRPIDEKSSMWRYPSKSKPSQAAASGPPADDNDIPPRFMGPRVAVRRPGKPEGGY